MIAAVLIAYLASSVVLGLALARVLALADRPHTPPLAAGSSPSQRSAQPGRTAA